VLEVGGGQIALLAQHLFGDEGTTGDVSEAYARPIASQGLGFVVCDLVHDDLPQHRDHFDAVILCEVIEHMPIPPHIVLEKVRTWLKPGGALLLTTPNLYRLRNALRLFLGMRVFCNWYYPPRGKGLGHPLEYSAEHLRFQIEQAGFTVERMDLCQLTNAGSHWWSKLGRVLLAPLLLRPKWRDSLLAVARRPSES
jgi:SAM-dependent methyltransferase